MGGLLQRMLRLGVFGDRAALLQPQLHRDAAAAGGVPPQFDQRRPLTTSAHVLTGTVAVAARRGPRAVAPPPPSLEIVSCSRGGGSPASARAKPKKLTKKQKQKLQLLLLPAFLEYFRQRMQQRTGRSPEGEDYRRVKSFIEAYPADRPTVVLDGLNCSGLLSRQESFPPHLHYIVVLREDEPRPRGFRLSANFSVLEMAAAAEKTAEAEPFKQDNDDVAAIVLSLALQCPLVSNDWTVDHVEGFRSYLTRTGGDARLADELRAHLERWRCPHDGKTFAMMPYILSSLPAMSRAG